MLAHLKTAHIKYHAILALIVLSTGIPVAAQGYGTQAAHFKIIRIEHQEDIEADYTSTQLIAIERLALSDPGAVAIGKFAISFSPEMESIKIEEAYTEKQGGQKIQIQPQQIHEQKGWLAPGTQISWPGMNTLQITFGRSAQVSPTGWPSVKQR